MTDKFICADCKGITYGNTVKKSRSGFKWLLFCFTGLVFPSFRFKSATPKKCQYCNSDFLLPADLPSTQDFLKQLDQSYRKKN